MTRFSAYLSSSLVGGLVLLCASCSTEDKSPLNAPAANGQPQPAQSQVRLQAPNPRSSNLTAKLNLYRAQSLSVLVPARADVSHSNVLYTAAVRHSVYMNSVNSVNYNPNGSDGLPVGVVTTAITPASPYAKFRSELVKPTNTSIFPAFLTNTDIYARFAAIVGSPDVLNAAGVANEFYVFNGDVPLDTGLNSEFRGYSDGDVIDSIWYSRRGRATLMRTDLSFIGYGSVDDQIQGQSPKPPPGWEVVGGKFLGSLATLSNAHAQHALSVWPKDFQTGVRTYGTDTDLDKISQNPTTVRHQYAGPPIHVTLPTTQPFLLHTATVAGGIRVGFRKAKASPLDTSLPQDPPRSDIMRAVTLVWKSNGSLASAIYLTNPPGEYEYEIVGNTTMASVGDELRNGELIMIPNEPLEPLTWYEVSVRLRTIDTSFPNTTNDSDFYTWHFQTDSSSPY